MYTIRRMPPPRVLPFLVPPPIVAAVVLRPEGVICRGEAGQEWPCERVLRRAKETPMQAAFRAWTENAVTFRSVA
jgi:hypothetical protein